MSGQWPPEWEDPDDGHPDAGLPDGEHPDAGYSDLELSEVTSFLASVRSPALPASFEARISAAIAAEAAARATTEPRAAAEPAGPLTAAAGADDAKDTVRSGDPEEFSPAATAGGPSTPAAPQTPPRRKGVQERGQGIRARGSRPDGRASPAPDALHAGGELDAGVLSWCSPGFGFLVTRGSGSSSLIVDAASAASSQSASAAAGSVAAAGRRTGVGSATGAR